MYSWEPALSEKEGVDGQHEDSLEKGNSMSGNSMSKLQEKEILSKSK